MNWLLLSKNISKKTFQPILFAGKTRDGFLHICRRTFTMVCFYNSGGGDFMEAIFFLLFNHKKFQA